MRDLTRIFKALSDESRLRVLNLLMERECCVCEVMQSLDISQSKASRILTKLYDVGILRLKKDGLWSLYSIDREGMGDDLNDILQAVTRTLSTNPVAAADRTRLKNAKRIGPAGVSRQQNGKAEA